MIVVDASALFQVLGGASRGETIEQRMFWAGEEICAPDLLDAEIISILRRHVLAKQLAEIRAKEMLRDYLALPLTRLPFTPVLARAFALRHTMTAYDAVYVALAESLGATLITRDAKLARAAAGVCKVHAF